MVFRDVRKKMQEETDAPNFGYHLSLVRTHSDVERVARRLIEEQFSKPCLKRPTGDDDERKDLHVAGMKELGKAERIRKYIEKLESQQDFLDNDWEKDNEDIQVEAADTVFLGDDENERWL